MASFESEVMRSFTLACEVIKDTVVGNIQSSAARGDVKLTNEQFAQIARIVGDAVDQGARNSAKQIQSTIAANKK